MEQTITIPVGARVYCTDGYGGILTQLVIDPVARRVTHVVVQDGSVPAVEHLVPVERIASAARDRVTLDCTQADLSTFEPFAETHYIRSGAKDFYEVYAFYPYAEFEAENVPIVDEHIPRGELTIRRGARVEANDGPAGMVAEFVSTARAVPSAISSWSVAISSASRSARCRSRRSGASAARSFL